MRRNKCWKAVIALTLIAAMLCGSALAATMSARVFTPTMTVYNSKSGKKIGALRRGTSFKVTNVSGNWARISYKGHTGYAKMENIVFDSRIKAVSTKPTSITFMTKGSYKKNVYYTGTLSAGVTLYLAGMSGSHYLFFDASGATMGIIKKSAVRKA